MTVISVCIWYVAQKECCHQMAGGKVGTAALWCSINSTRQGPNYGLDSRELYISFWCRAKCQAVYDELHEKFRALEEEYR